ncbi:MAG: excinuclease ABC subunit UvrA [Dehalococcoidia bacterium]|nr:excinuclease ABC subunit UvrA [Dehalococcoidia bacterium]
MPIDRIVVTGAREHNLKNITVEIPRDRLVVITGVSGSGKSSLAFDTIYAEGQRRYVESLSAYARQFLGLMEKPDVDYIEGLSPAISIDQKGVSKNPRSTVATVTEIYDYLRLLFARVGTPTCPHCGQVIRRQTVQQIVDSVLGLDAGRRAMILAPVIRHRKGEHAQVFEAVRRGGYVRVRVDGQVLNIDDEIALNKNKWHDIDVVTDRIVIPATGDEEFEATRSRVTDSVEQALRLGEGIVVLALLGDDGAVVEEQTYSEQFACSNTDHPPYSVGEIEPRNFSFNTPHGACPACTGLGFQMRLDEDLVVPNKKLSIGEGAIVPFQRMATSASWYRRRLSALAEAMGFTLDQAVETLTEVQWRALMRGTGDLPVDEIEIRSSSGSKRKYKVTWEGVITNLERRYRETESDWVRSDIERYMVAVPCTTCHGARLKPEVLHVFIDGKSILDVSRMSVSEALPWVEALRQEDGGPLTAREFAIGRQILQEIHGRLVFLRDVGLDYLTLDRSAGTLSGGEGQRIRLATQIGSALMGVLYVCDEPSVGLHPIDNERLIHTLTRLRDLGNTVLVVEHDEAMMMAADHLIDIGPGAGEHGGEVVAFGPPQEVAKAKGSVTGAYLSGRRMIPMPEERRPGNGRELVVMNARENNLKGLDVAFPLGTFIAVTGVSGSGKSSLVNQILSKALAHELNGAREKPGAHDRITGVGYLDKVVVIDQSPIGRTPRSNPATYTGLFTQVRDLFAQNPEAKARGYGPGRFSFNVKGGRCEACKGDGYNLIEMQFLPDVTVPCEVCKGDRYNREALEILFRGKNIAEVLKMTVTEALEYFEAFPGPRRKLETLKDVGLGYIRLGQPATTLSGGEAQRIKLATELSKRSTGRTAYILDEPTTGLSFSDVEALLHVLQRLVDGGNTVIVIEHHLDVIKGADWVIDLGPHGGGRGGELIATGTPEDVAAVEDSITGRFLRDVLAKHGAKPAARKPSKGGASKANAGAEKKAAASTNGAGAAKAKAPAKGRKRATA